MAGSRTLKLSILADVDNLKKNLDGGAKEVEGFGGKLEKFGKVAAAAFAAAAAAAAAYAGKLAIEGVKAAIEDQAAQERLANSLRNVTGATNAQIKAVEDNITKMSLSIGVADDQLRPAFQRLAVATGSVAESNKLLSLALDVSAATGKSVESVANALGKAYEGNTASLGRLGIGLSSAELKTMSFDEVTQALANTFGNAATVQANTFEGQVNRLKVSFDEAKESVGAGLLPILTKMLDYFVNTLIPKFIEAKDRAIAPIKRAFEDNEEAIRTLWAFTKNYLIPLFETGLVRAIETAGKAIGTIITIVSKAVTSIEWLIDKALDGINALIRAYNKIPGLPDIPTINTNPQSGSNSVPMSSMPFGGGRAAGGSVIRNTSYLVGENGPELFTPGSNGTITPNNKLGGGNINITVNGAIDPVTTARQIASILNGEAANAGSFTDLGLSRFSLRS